MGRMSGWNEHQETIIEHAQEKLLKKMRKLLPKKVPEDWEKWRIETLDALWRGLK